MGKLFEKSFPTPFQKLSKKVLLRNHPRFFKVPYFFDKTLDIDATSSDIIARERRNAS